MTRTPLLILGAAFALAACNPVTAVEKTDNATIVIENDVSQKVPAKVEAAAGPVKSGDTLAGRYDLTRKGCDDMNSMTRLMVEGNKMTFAESSCTVAASEKGSNYTNATLSCTGEGKDFNRQVKLQLRGDSLRMTEGANTYTYFSCAK